MERTTLGSRIIFIRGLLIGWPLDAHVQDGFTLCIPFQPWGSEDVRLWENWSEWGCHLGVEKKKKEEGTHAWSDPCHFSSAVLIPLGWEFGNLFYRAYLKRYYPGMLKDAKEWGWQCLKIRTSALSFHLVSENVSISATCSTHIYVLSLVT